MSNYTFFFGNLTEEEQQYRDYFETDLEVDPEDDWIDEKMDEMHIAEIGELDPALYDFVDYTQVHDAHEDYDDVVEQKLFKYKYRQNATDELTFERRWHRVRDRFLERAKTRDPALEQSLSDLFATDARETSFATLALEPEKFRLVAEEETRPFREYMANEAINQYKDFYESDDEEQSFFEYMDNFTNRDRIRFMEIFEDYTVDKADNKDFVMIEKREYNPELSVLSNMVLDLVDFKDRVRPLSNDVAMLEQANKFQKNNAETWMSEQEEFQNTLKAIREGTLPDSAFSQLIGREGQKKVEPQAAEPAFEAIEDVPEPVEEAPVEEPPVEEEHAEEEAPAEEKEKDTEDK